MTASQRVSAAMQRIPSVWLALGAIASAAMIGASAAVLLTIPARVAALETWRVDLIDPGMRFLICSQDAINEGRDPKPCGVLLQGLAEMLTVPPPSR